MKTFSSLYKPKTKTPGPLQANLSGTYRLDYATLTLFPIRYDQKPYSRSKNRECYNIRLGQINSNLLWVNHKDFTSECCQILWHTLAADATQDVIVFSYGGKEYYFQIQADLMQESNQVVEVQIGLV